ncbi:class II glutamine amidotransferase [Ruminococcus sp.]|uniref:class II glutamine amidotransferase n=1 Tax=Ruminococcus sp. TaxID=41978 RepID=UPI0025EF0526|nr:class II glutamine amidotransferase [Ruminococcus sp.]
MCAVYGFLDYGKKINHKMLTKILRELSVAAEVRGTDATGISYVRNNEMVTFKKASPAHKVRLFFPMGTTAVIGHTRMTTQGSEKKNYNNHPFEGSSSRHRFSLAHNGVLYNEKEIRHEKQLPQTKIETDSYIAVQLLEQGQTVDLASVKAMAEAVEGSFTFTILRDDNTLFLVKGTNPLAIYHYPEFGLYLYASTDKILQTALQKSGFNPAYQLIPINDGDMIQINPDGTMKKNSFKILTRIDWQYHYDYLDWLCEDDDLLDICTCFGVSREDVHFLRSCGFASDEIEELLLDTEYLQELLHEMKSVSEK